MELYLDQYPKDALRKKIGNFDKADLQKYYTRAQDKDDEIVTIASRSRQIRRKLQKCTNTAPPSGFNISQATYPPLTSGITQEDAEYEDTSLMG